MGRRAARGAVAEGPALLLYLCVRADDVPRREAGELLWTAHAARNLRHEIHGLRKLPGAERWFASGDPLGIAAESDLARFEAAVAAGRHEDALRAWRGPPLQEFEVPAAAFEDWAAGVRRRGEELLVRALKGRLDELFEEGRYAEAVELVERLLQLDPLDESAYRTAMRLHYARGDPEAALRLFEACRRTLAQELGVEPLEPTHALAHDIESAIEAPRPSFRSARHRVPTRLLRPPTLIGREAEWAVMEEAWSRGASIFLAGPAGIGKSRLLLDFARSRGTYLLNEGRPGDAHLPYSSVARALGRVFAADPAFGRELAGWARDELSRILPRHLREPRPAPNARIELQPRLMEAVLHMMDLLRPRVDALPADDIHYYDATSGVIGNAVSAHFAMEPRPDSAGMLMAFRQDEMPRSTLEGIDALRRTGAAVLIELGPLDPDGIGELLANLDVPDRDDLSSLLHRYTGGNPMFALETLKSMALAGGFSAESLRRTKPAGRVDAVIRHRFGRLSARASRLVRAVAVAQPAADARLLAIVLDVDAREIAEGLAELERAQILSGERFVHDLLYEYALHGTPAPILGWLHRRSAEALVELAGDPEQIARHWQAAGERERAVTQWLEAARRFRDRSLHDGAAAMLELAITHAPTPELALAAKRESERGRTEPEGE